MLYRCLYGIIVAVQILYFATNFLNRVLAGQSLSLARRKAAGAEEATAKADRVTCSGHDWTRHHYVAYRLVNCHPDLHQIASSRVLLHLPPSPTRFSISSCIDILLSYCSRIDGET